MAIEAKVAQILSDKRLVLNKGASDGVTEYTEFSVYEIGEEIFDPETKESLGNLEVVKGLFSVVDLQEKLCVVEVTKEPVTTRHYSGGWANLNMFGSKTEEITTYQPAKIKIAKTNSGYEQQRTIKVGDNVRSK